MQDQDLDSSGGFTGDASSGGGNWWEGPRPASWPATAPWPPTLAPGDSYGAAVGSVVKAPGTAGPYPGTNVTPGVDIPVPGQTPKKDPEPVLPPPPPGTPQQPPGPGTIGSLTAPFTETYTPPTPTPLPTAPDFAPPPYTPPPAFEYPDFSFAMTPEQLASDPGFQFRERQGRDSLERSAAARGVLNSGGTLKDILDYGQQAASQEGQNVFNRQYAIYGVNRGNAVDTYNSRYQTQYIDPYKFSYQGALDTFTPKQSAWQTNAANVQHTNDMGATYGFNTWLQDYNIFRNQQNDTFDKIYRYATA